MAEKLGKKLATWKRRYLSLGVSVCITLTESALYIEQFASISIICFQDASEGGEHN